jgi:alpha-glucosidase
LYRQALRLRHEHPALGDGTLRWLVAPAGILMFARDPGFVCVVNLSDAPVPVPGGEVMLASGPLTDERALPADSAVWLSLHQADGA